MLLLRRGLAIVNKRSATQTAYAIYRAVIQSYLTACVRLCRYVAKLSMNSTANGFSGSWSCLNFSALKIGGTVTYCLIFIVSLVANSLIVMIVYKTPNLRKPINYFIANMASSDLLYPIFLMPWKLSFLHTNTFLIGGQLGQALCKLVPFIISVSFVVSIQNLILIAVDRFGAVVFPLRSPLIRSKLCPFFILATWIVAMAVNSPDLFTFELHQENSGEIYCTERWEKAFGESSSSADFTVASYIVFIYLPVMLLAILYSIIFIKLKTQVHPGEQSTNNQQQRDRRNRNVLQMSIAIITVFVFCWLPYSINYLIWYWDTSMHFSCSFRQYLYFTLDMTNAHSAINPIICFMFSGNYRKALKRLIKCSFAQA